MRQLPGTLKTPRRRWFPSKLPVDLPLSLFPKRPWRSLPSLRSFLSYWLIHAWFFNKSSLRFGKQHYSVFNMYSFVLWRLIALCARVGVIINKSDFLGRHSIIKVMQQVSIRQQFWYQKSIKNKQRFNSKIFTI